MKKVYAAYTYDSGWFGWVWGWYLVKIVPTRDLAMGILEDIHNEGLNPYFMLLEMEPPLPDKFWFKPKAATRLIHAEAPESKSPGESANGRLDSGISPP